MVKGSRENEKWYNQLLVIRNMPSTNNRQVSWLADLFYPFLCFGLLQRKRHLKFPYSVLFRNACIPALLAV